MRDVAGVSMKVKDDRTVFSRRKKPSVNSFAVLGVEEDFLVLKAKFLWTEVKMGLGEVNEETFDPGIEQKEARDQNQDKNYQVSPVDRHEQHLPERFVSSHEPIIADPFPPAKSKNPVLIEPGTGGVVS
jgi:hypothetical protein